ncbi:hypothetical protein N9N34_03290 [Candidatus Pelagibacter bacterium]|nr:hypothetical protein [Candidatus Pelagibacter bacterium]
MIKTIAILIVFVPNIAFASDYLQSKKGVEYLTWNELVYNYYNSFEERNNWNDCVKRSPIKLDGKYRRVVECYTEAEVNRFNDYNLNMNEKIIRVVRSCMRNIWDYADAVDGTIILQSSLSTSRAAAREMNNAVRDCENNRIPKELAKAFEEENNRVNLNKAMALAKQREAKEKAKKDKQLNLSSKSLLKKLLNKE